MWEPIWVAWIGAFLVIEGIALVRKERGDTLSENVWRWFSIKDRKPGYKTRRFVLLTFLAWLVTHFLTGGWV